MTDHENSQGEPTMEEILASIRRIISEDNDETEGTTAAASGTGAGGSRPAAGPHDRTEPQPDAEVLELSPAQMVSEDRQDRPEPAAEPRLNGLDMSASRAANESSAPEPAADKPAASGESRADRMDDKAGSEVEETLLSPEVATAAAAAFGALSKDVVVTGSGGVKSLEELVREMMKPMLKEWLDDNLPPLVEEVIEREVHRLSHRRVRR